jgi:hypothetical protein
LALGVPVSLGHSAEGQRKIQLYDQEVLKVFLQPLLHISPNYRLIRQIF